MNCPHCAALVEVLLAELDGSLHSCPPHILARAYNRRSLVDESWWARMQAETGTAREQDGNVEVRASRGGVAI